MKYLKHPFIAFCISLGVVSCDDTPQKPEKVISELPADSIGDEVYGKAKDIFYSLPSPIEMTTLLKTNGGVYQNNIVLDANKANDFITHQTQALALGVYGADLSYAAVFDQKQQALKLLAATERIASKLGIEEAYSAEYVERANQNLGNRDSVLTILSEVYWETNSELKENNRNEMAMIILGAGWAEGMYIGATLLDNEEKDPDLVKRMMEQKFAATELQRLFEKYAENDIVSESYQLFAPLLDVFATIDVSVESTSMQQEESTGKFIIGGTTNMNYNENDIDNLILAAYQVRENMIGEK